MKDPVITRIWHGRTAAERAEEYLSFLFRTAVDGYKSIEGNISVEIWRRPEGEVCHFWTVTKWSSYESIRKFAGDDLEKAKYYPDDAEYLLEFEPNVQHCETYQFD